MVFFLKSKNILLCLMTINHFLYQLHYYIKLFQEINNKGFLKYIFNLNYFMINNFFNNYLIIIFLIVIFLIIFLQIQNLLILYAFINYQLQ
jgi:hypothetical protein